MNPQDVADAIAQALVQGGSQWLTASLVAFLPAMWTMALILHIGRPYVDVPDPWDCHDSWSTHYKEPVLQTFDALGADVAAECRQQVDEARAVGRVAERALRIEADRVDRAARPRRVRDTGDALERGLLQRMREVDAGEALGRERGESRSELGGRRAQRAGFDRQAEGFESGAVELR